MTLKRGGKGGRNGSVVVNQVGRIGEHKKSGGVQKVPIRSREPFYADYYNKHESKGLDLSSVKLRVLESVGVQGRKADKTCPYFEEGHLTRPCCYAEVFHVTDRRILLLTGKTCFLRRKL